MYTQIYTVVTGQFIGTFAVQCNLLQQLFHEFCFYDACILAFVDTVRKQITTAYFYFLFLLWFMFNIEVIVGEAVVLECILLKVRSIPNMSPPRMCTCILQSSSL